MLSKTSSLSDSIMAALRNRRESGRQRAEARHRVTSYGSDSYVYVPFYGAIHKG